MGAVERRPGSRNAMCEAYDGPGITACDFVRRLPTVPESPYYSDTGSTPVAERVPPRRR